MVDSRYIQEEKKKKSIVLNSPADWLFLVLIVAFVVFLVSLLLQIIIYLCNGDCFEIFQAIAECFGDASDQLIQYYTTTPVLESISLTSLVVIYFIALVLIFLGE